MKSKSRRFEVLFPVRFNDGTDVPEDLIGEAVDEIIQQFAAVTFFKNAAEGMWRHEGITYRDELGLLVIDLPDTEKNRKWMKAYKAKWKKQLKQLEIWMISYPIDIE